jgi:hypothetical protein
LAAVRVGSTLFGVVALAVASLVVPDKVLSKTRTANIEDIKNAATALLADEQLANLPLFGLGVCFGA